MAPASTEEDGTVAPAGGRKSPDAPLPLSMADLRDVIDAVRPAFPRELSSPELVLIDVDPLHLHAFWNLPLRRLEDVRAQLSPAEDDPPMMLRLMHADGTAAFDVDVQGLQGQTYVDIWDEHRRWRADLGLRLANGSLAVLIAGNTAELPRLGPATLAAGEIVVPAPPTARVAPQPPAPEPAPTAKTAPGGFHVSEPITEPLPSPPIDAMAAEPPPAAEVSGAGGEPAAADATAAAPTLELENVMSLSSFVFGQETVQLEVNAELHIFGRAKPGSELRLFGRRVSLRPDGTFSIRRPLPNGALVLTALLAGGDQS